MATPRGRRERPYRVWFDGRQLPPERTEVWELVKHSTIDSVVLLPKQQQEMHLPLHTQVVLAVEGEADLEAVQPGQAVMSASEPALAAAAAKGHPTCFAAFIDSREVLEQVCLLASHYDYMVVDFDLPTNIPLELIIATLQGSHTAVFKRETNLAGVETAFGVMEQGSDGVLLVTGDLQEISKVARYLAGANHQHLTLQPVIIEEVRHIGMGVRGCIDTVGLLAEDEGMIVGSTSAGGVFVCSETHFLPYMNLRPFRVNAGAVHSYVWTAGGRAEYITDLGAGSKALCVNTKGEAREIAIGRMKIEVRPLLLILGQAQGRKINVIVQDDWHIRLMGADGRPRNATLIRPGDQLLGYIDEPGRHVGMRIEETIIER